MGIKKVKKWLRDQVTAISIAVSNVEKAAIGQEGKKLETGNSNQEKKQTETSLLKALLNGEVNQEVRNLRWRMYKIIQETQNYTTKIVGFSDEVDEDGNKIPILEVVSFDKNETLKNIRIDSFDKYPLEMVINNTDNTLGISETLEKMNISEDSNNVNNINYFTNNKTKSVLSITRDSIPQFDIESFSTRLNVRVINDTDRLLEFYVSKYPDEYNRTSRLFISEIKKIIDGKRSNMLDIKDVEFITYNTVGVRDFLNFKYNVIKFDKIVEFNGYYVIKFISKVEINGENILLKYKEEILDELYDKKSPRKHTI